MQFVRPLLALTTLATVAVAPQGHGTTSPTSYPATVDILSTAGDGGVYGDGSPYVGDEDGTFEFRDHQDASDEMTLALGPGRGQKIERTITLTRRGEPHTCAWTDWDVADRSEDQAYANWHQMTTAQLGAQLLCGGERSEPTFQLTWTHRVPAGPRGAAPITESLEIPCVSATRDGDTWTFEAGTDCVVEVATRHRGEFRFNTTISQPFRFTATAVTS